MTFQAPSPSKLFGALAMLLTQGCAIGAGMGVMSASLGPTPEFTAGKGLGSGLASNGPLSTTHPYYEFQLIDYSGMLLSLVTSAGATNLERERAMDRARSMGAKAGDVVEYEAKYYAPVPGLRTDMLIRFSPHAHYLFDGNEAFDERGLPVTYNSQSYFGMDIVNTFNAHGIGDTPLSYQFAVNARIENFSSERVGTWGAGYEPSDFHADVYLGAALNYVVNPTLSARLDADLGIVSPIMALLGFGTLSHTVQLQAMYQPTTWMYLRGYTNWKRQSFIDRGGNLFTAGVNVGFGKF